MALPIDMQSLPAWLSQQRWFGGKGAAISGVRDLDRAQLSPGLLLSAVEVRYEPPRPAESYALALRPWTGKGGIVEGLDDDALTRVHSPIMSPLVWDLGHIAAYEDLWLDQRLAGLELLRADLAELYDAFETPRAEIGRAHV